MTILEGSELVREIVLLIVHLLKAVEGRVGLLKFDSNFIRIAARDGVTSVRKLIDSCCATQRRRQT